MVVVQNVVSVHVTLDVRALGWSGVAFDAGAGLDESLMDCTATAKFAIGCHAKPLQKGEHEALQAFVAWSSQIP